MGLGLLARRPSRCSRRTFRTVNACESLDGADDLLRTAPAVIGMSDSIGDTAAIVFAATLYSAIASAHSVQSAVEQGRARVAASSLGDSELPEFRCRDDIDPAAMVLVTPLRDRQLRIGRSVRVRPASRCDEKKRRDDGRLRGFLRWGACSTVVSPSRPVLSRPCLGITSPH